MSEEREPLAASDMSGQVEMDWREIPISIDASSDEGTEQLIPRVINQTFLTTRVSSGLWNASRSWIENNTDYSYRFFDDEACFDYIRDEVDQQALSTYEALPKGAFRADFWRYCLLWREGGVYADIDTVCASPLRDVIRADDQFVVPEGSSGVRKFNAFMCSVPRNRVLEHIIETAPVYLRLGWHPFDAVGPHALGLAINHLLGLRADEQLKAGDYDAAGMAIRILAKRYPSRLTDRVVGKLRSIAKLSLERNESARVMAGSETVLYASYPGYQTDLRLHGVSHWGELDSIE